MGGLEGGEGWGETIHNYCTILSQSRLTVDCSVSQFEFVHTKTLTNKLNCHFNYHGHGVLGLVQGVVLGQARLLVVVVVVVVCRALGA